MKRLPLTPSLSWVLAAAASALTLCAQNSGPSVQMAPYEVTAPKFTTAFQEFYEKLDNLFDGPWIDAGRSGALIEAIIWRHGYLAVHPSDQAVILVQKRGDQVVAATTVYTLGAGLYANSWALGEHQRLAGLTAADINDLPKIRHAIGDIRDVYLLSTSFRDGGGFAPGSGGFDGSGRVYSFGDPFGPNGYYIPPVLGAYTAQPDPVDVTYTERGNFLFRSGSTDISAPIQTAQYFQPFTGVGYPIFAVNGLIQYAGDRFHESGDEMLDTVYRALRDPNQAGLVPVSLGKILVTPRGRAAAEAKPESVPVIAFDWEGVHYVYRPYHATIGQEIPRNPVTGQPYLCVKDGALLESIYFCATYTRDHPGEKVALIEGDLPAAVYTANGHVCIFCPGLNRVGEMKALTPDALGQPAVLARSLGEMKARVGQLAAARAQSRGARTVHDFPQRLAGDTADSQMRRAFIALHAAGLPVHLQSGEASSLTFSWQGVNYLYGPDQHVARLN